VLPGSLLFAFFASFADKKTVSEIADRLLREDAHRSSVAGASTGSKRECSQRSDVSPESTAPRAFPAAGLARS